MPFRGFQIIETDEFQAAVLKLGGYRFVDEALATVMDGLMRNPFGFKMIENEFSSFRYAITKRIGHIPPLVVIFRIERPGTIYLEDVFEEDEPY